MSKRRDRNRIQYRSRGAVLAEAVASLALIVPIIFLVLLGCVEAAYAFVIGYNMNEAAYTAARALANTYKKYPSIVSDTNAQADIFATIRMQNMVSSNDQFSIPDGGWQLLQNPRTVTVTVQYLGGQGDPPLPLYPNPDFFNVRKNLQIQSSATFCLN